MNLINLIQSKIEKFRIERVKKSFGYCGKGVKIFTPYKIAGANLIEIDDYARIMSNPTIVAYGKKFIVKKFAVISYNLTVVTSNHCPTVGIPFSFSDGLHINEKFKGDVVVGEECWLGANVTLLPGAKLSRGCVVGANSVINKEYPPYAVVVGSPARIVGARFTRDQIIRHESLVYPENDRLSIEYIDTLFANVYKDITRTIGTEGITATDRARLEEFVKHSNANIEINL